jgi:hypothetical protein
MVALKETVCAYKNLRQNWLLKSTEFMNRWGYAAQSALSSQFAQKRNPIALTEADCRTALAMTVNDHCTIRFATLAHTLTGHCANVPVRHPLVLQSLSHKIVDP